MNGPYLVGSIGPSLKVLLARVGAAEYFDHRPAGLQVRRNPEADGKPETPRFQKQNAPQECDSLSWHRESKE